MVNRTAYTETTVDVTKTTTKYGSDNTAVFKSLFGLQDMEKVTLFSYRKHSWYTEDHNELK
jgi:hypothetical protein